LLTRTSSGPSCSSTESTNASNDERSVTLSGPRGRVVFRLPVRPEEDSR
jgi:hypothetical protein